MHSINLGLEQVVITKKVCSRCLNSGKVVFTSDFWYCGCVIGRRRRKRETIILFTVTLLLSFTVGIVVSTSLLRAN